MRKIYFLLVLLSLSVAGFAEDVVLRITNHAEAQEFITGGVRRETVDILFVTGSDLLQSDFVGLEGRIKEVRKELRFENITNDTPVPGAVPPARTGYDFKSFFTNVVLGGSIIVNNVPYLSWDWVGNLQSVINGDLILDHCTFPFPGVNGWADETTFGGIEEVKGNLIIGSRIDLQKFNEHSFTKLRRVGGDFRLFCTGATDIWNVTAPELKYIGGDFEVRGPEGGMIGTKAFQMWNTEILKNVEYIGGDVTWVNCPRMPIGQGNEGNKGTGWCFIRYLIDAGVINYACHNVILGWEDEPVDLASLGGCMYGFGDEQDFPPATLPAKNPDCTSGIRNVNKPAGFASVRPTYVKEDLMIDSPAVLAKVEIVDVAGKTMISVPRFASNSLSVAKLPKGVYLVKLTNDKNQVQTVKIIKQ
ncbi:MAG: T9SS type A sorting domain-containing protein [Dysgonamonadaceae bacterium]|jgi:hypothetical protein|nr:T9SS type A sorting domain-containing protein [Dysgonamonadaceae bacterium]